MNGYLPDGDQALIAWANNFVTVATANLAALGLTSSQLDTLAGGVTDAANNLTDITAQKAQLKGSYNDKDSNLALIREASRTLVKPIQINTTISDALKGQLQIPLSNQPRSKTSPVTPDTLVAAGLQTGVNTLKWNTTGNKPTTNYVILAKPFTGPSSILSDTDWAMVGTTTRARFDHVGVTPSAPMAYKVQATRAGDSSVPSAPATVYTG